MGGLGGASLEEGCWSVVGGGGGVGGEGLLGNWWRERRGRKEEGRLLVSG